MIVLTFLLKVILAVVGLGIIAVAVVGYISELTQDFGFVIGLIGAAVVFGILARDSVSEFLGVTNGLLDGIAFGALVGGGILCQMEFGKIGGAMVTGGWIAIGLILMQVIPIPVISNMIEIISIPFTVVCIPLLFFVVLIIGFFW